MPTNTQMHELLHQWEQMKREGRRVAVEDLCRDCPELIETLRKKIGALEAVDRMLLSAPAEARHTLMPAEDAPAASSPATDTQPPLADTRPAIASELQTLPAVSETIYLREGAEPVPGFRLVSLLGRGGFGEVWKATGPGGFFVAMKFVSQSGHGVKVEMRALEIIKAIRHPNLLTTFGVWQIPGWVVIGMELADRTLSDRQAEAVQHGLPGIPRDELLEYLQEAAKGIDYLNEPQPALAGKQGGGVQHRDIKPQNILIVGRGVKVADFGLARLLEHAMTTHTGSLTPAYAAPEFIRGQTSNRSDQYSLAVTYCELRGGLLPFEGTLESVLLGHLERPPDLSMLPDEERAIVARALAKNPANRWPSCRSFVEALAQATREAGNSIAYKAPVATSTRRRLRAISSLMLGALVGTLVWAAFIRRDDTRPDVSPNDDGQVTDVSPERPVAEVNVASVPADTIEVASNASPRESAEPADVSVAVARESPPTAPPTTQVELAAEPVAETAAPSTIQVAPPAASVAPPVTTPAIRLGELVCFEQHTGGVRSVAVSANNRHVLSAGDDCVVRLWDLETGLEIHRFVEHSAPVNCIAFSPDGLRAISGGEDHALWLWDVAGRKKLHPLRGHTEAVYCVAFSADGRRALSGGNDAIMRLWDIETGEEVKHFEIPIEMIWSLAFCADDRHVLVAGESNVIQHYDLETGTAVKRLERHADVVWSVAYCPKTGRAISGGGDIRKQRDFSLRLWDVDRGVELHRFERHLGAIGGVAISPDGRRALSGSADETVKLWDLESRQELHSFTGHTGNVQGVAFSPDGRRALSASSDGTVRVWGLPE
jgi:serine/threonine protein kinase